MGITALFLAFLGLVNFAFPSLLEVCLASIVFELLLCYVWTVKVPDLDLVLTPGACTVRQERM